MEEFEPGHSDRVTVLHVNYDGSRILTASIDHRIKVWNRDSKTGERSLVDTFTAHDADIRDAKFLHPTLGTYIGTIGADLKFHLWTEDVSQPPNSGRRFKRVTTIASTPRIPFSSLDFRTVEHVYTYLALIDRQGLLSIYEPTSPDDLKEWSLLDQFHVTHPVPARGEETSFKVRFDQNPSPLAYYNSVSDDPNQLGLVVSCLNDVKIYHSNPSNSIENTSSSPLTDPSSHQNSERGNGTHRLTFHESFRLPPHPALVRDVAWSPFNVRGTDRIATACKDGAIRIFELGMSAAPEYAISSTNPKGNLDIAKPNSKEPSSHQSERQHPTRAPSRLPPSAGGAQSSLTSAITGTSNRGGGGTNQNQNPNQPQQSSNIQPTTSSASTHQSSNTQSSQSQSQKQTYPFSFKYHLLPTATLPNAHTDAWSVIWDPAGQVLMSSGADGKVKIWRKAVLSSTVAGGNAVAGGPGAGQATSNNGWMLFADQSVEFGDGDEDDEDGGGEA